MGGHATAERGRGGGGAVSLTDAPTVEFPAVRDSRDTLVQLLPYRGLAASSVVLFHAYQFTHPGAGAQNRTSWFAFAMTAELAVSLFFVLSGFLLGLRYVRACLGQARPQPARRFLVKRAVRILPLYFVVVLIVWCSSNPKLPGDWRDLVLHLTFTQVYSREKIFFTDGPAWSLAVEVHFYLLLALLGALAQRACRRLSTTDKRVSVLVLGTVALIALSAGYKLYAREVWHAPADDWPVWFSPPAKLDIFALGLLGAVIYGAGFRLRTNGSRLLTAILGIVVLGYALADTLRHGEPGVFVHTLTSAGCTLLLAVNIAAARPGPRWVRAAPLMFLGLISYSLYLWHEPMLRVLRALHVLPDPSAPAAFPLIAAELLAAAVLVAWPSWLIIERTSSQFLHAFDADGRPADYYAGADSVYA